MTIKDIVIEVLAEKALLRPSDISKNNSLSDLGLDSMGTVEIIFSLEEKFNIDIDVNLNTKKTNAFDVSTVNSIIESVETLLENMDEVQS